jgi:hypothetical protein
VGVVRPWADIHQSSGVFYDVTGAADSVGLNASGILRYAPTLAAPAEGEGFELALGSNPGVFHPLPHSGQVQESICQKMEGQPLSWWVDVLAERMFDNNTFPSTNFSVPAPTDRNGTDPSGLVGVFILDTGQVDRFAIQFPIPHELDLTMPVSGMMYFRRASGGGDNTNVQLVWTLRVNNPGEDFTDTTVGTNIFHTTDLAIPNGANDVLLIAEIGTLFPGGTFTQDSLVHGSFTRDDTRVAADDHGSDIDFAGIKFVGTRKVV